MGMFVIGVVLGLLVLFVDVRRPTDARRRSLTHAEAVGYRAALGENPVTMQTRAGDRGGARYLTQDSSLSADLMGCE